MKLTKQITEEISNIQPQKIKDALQDINIHGFKFTGFEATHETLIFKHETIGLTLLASPLTGLTDQQQTMQVSVHGETDVLTLHRGEHNTNFTYEGELDLPTFLKNIQTFIETELQSQHQKQQTEFHPQA